MIKKENFISSVGANTQPGYVEQMIAQHNEDFASHGAHFHEVAEDLNVHEQKDMHLQEGERKRWDLAAETVSKIPDEVKKDADRAEVSADNASVSELTANAAAAAAKMAKEHAAFYRDRAEKYAADSQAAAGIAVNAKTAAEQAYGNTLNMAGQMSIEHNEMRTAFENLEDAYESFETNFDKKADKQTAGGGFVGGLGAVSADSSSAVGKGAQAKNGGFAGGSGTFANAGFAGGMSAKVHFYGGAAGRNAIAGAGFSGGDGAIAGKKANEADRVNCIQLGAGVNNVEGSLQVYGFQLMDGNGKIPEERLPELEKHFVLRGTVSDLDSLPDSKNVGDVYIVESERQFSKPCAQVVGGMELFEKNGESSAEFPTYQLSETFVNNFSDYVLIDDSMPGMETYQSYLYNPDGSFFDAMFRGAAVYDYLNGLNGYESKLPSESRFSFYVCKERGLKMSGGLYVWNGLCWDRISPEVFADSVYTKAETDAKINGASLWGGVVSSWGELPAEPNPGMFCYVSNDIANGEKYTGKASDMFYDMSDLYTNDNGPALGPIKFTAPNNCIRPDEYIVGFTAIYDVDGTYVTTIQYEPTSLPDHFYGGMIGASTLDDTVTFYLGYWNGTNFPAKIEDFSAGSMIFWNGTKWCGVASSDTVGDIESALDGILSIQAGLIDGGSV